MQVEVVTKYTDNHCPSDAHRFFALEMVGVEGPPHASVSPVVCTQCGTMIVYKITL